MARRTRGSWGRVLNPQPGSASTNNEANPQCFSQQLSRNGKSQFCLCAPTGAPTGPHPVSHSTLPGLSPLVSSFHGQNDSGVPADVN